MIRLFLILIPVAICLTTFGQNEFGIKGNGGISKITANRNLSNETSKFIFAPSGQAGLFYNLNLGKKSLIGIELLLSQIESKEEMKITNVDNFGNPTGEIGTTNLDYHISYLSIPVYYGFKLKKLTINLGFQTSLALASRGHWISNAPYQGGTLSFEDDGKLNIDKFDFGPRAGIMFNLSKHLAVEATYYYGVNNILSTTAPHEWNWKVQQITIGLRYKLRVFVRKNKPKEEKNNSSH